MTDAKLEPPSALSIAFKRNNANSRGEESLIILGLPDFHDV